jgi:hypothetical protein
LLLDPWLRRLRPESAQCRGGHSELQTTRVTKRNVLPWPRWVLDRVGFFKSYIEKFWGLKSFKMRKHGKTWENMRKHG